MSEKDRQFSDNGGARGLRLRDQIRPARISMGVLPDVDGSAYMEIGHTKLYVSVYGPYSNLKLDVDESPLRIEVDYHMTAAPFGRWNRRAKEISQKISEVFQQVIDDKEYLNCILKIKIEVIGSDAGTRAAAISATSVALVDAGILLKCVVPSISVGIYNGQILLDIEGIEDTEGEADMPVAMNPDTGGFLLFQFDGLATQTEFENMLNLARIGLIAIYDLQIRAIRERIDNLDGNKGRWNTDAFAELGL